MGKATQQELEQALAAPNPAEPLTALARSLRDRGVEQVTIYLLFEEQYVKTDGDDPLYDALADTMEFIYSGPWAKGLGLFEHELTEDEIKSHRRD